MESEEKGFWGEVARRYHNGASDGIYVEFLEYEVTSMQPSSHPPLETCKKVGNQYMSEGWLEKSLRDEGELPL